METKHHPDLEIITKMFREYLSADRKKQAKVLKDTAEKVAKLFAEDKTSKHQIRKHYHRLLDIKERIKTKNTDDIKEFYPEIAMTAAYATYDRSRNNIGNAFERFLKELTNEAINSNKDNFLKLMTLFEAVVGYANMYVKKN
ncbi:MULTISPECIES: type III-A CRISPR-associated protein Csm2 [unclassified Desulfurobacterium]|uniref:type III-A CRISPR-associated protein Csm2 n=1 Tax=unclassified Desulfurobacterium TaxID=2639089 RepID=UPI0003B7658E|nr:MULTISPECIES: type III-A CRISPR-associated protein Csm2 [unclassified Desulfurobacterium]